MGILVDELANCKQPTGNRRLSDAVAECEARASNALPLAAKELTRFSYYLWETRKAAERWIAKDPQRHIEI